jgi:hypothetical protein
LVLGENEEKENQDKTEGNLIDTEKLSQKEKDAGRDSLAKELTQDHVSELFYTPGSLRNILS